jgi:hypothetical protein
MRGRYCRPRALSLSRYRDSAEKGNRVWGKLAQVFPRRSARWGGRFFEGAGDYPALSAVMRSAW